MTTRADCERLDRDDPLAALRAHFETARTLGARFGLRADTVENPPQY